MARGKSLVYLLDQLRSECRLSTNPAQNTQLRDSQVNILQRVQDWLWEDYDWAHLRVDRTIALQAGQRYYDTPEDIQIDKILSIAVRFNSIWTTLCPSITDVDYIVWDSDMGQRGWPVQKWRITEDQMIEIWPIPDSNGNQPPDLLEGTLRVRGIKNLSPLVNDDDVCDLDSRLLVLYAASELLTSTNAPDAKIKKAMADRLYMKLRGGMMPKRKFTPFGKGEKRGIPLRGMPTVYYRVVTEN
jgi:hypothetical protein